MNDNLPDVRDDRSLPERLGDSHWIVPTTASVAAALMFGAVAFFGGPAGVAIFGGGSRSTGTSAAPCVYAAPNAPILLTVISPDTSTVIGVGSAFVGTCDDTHDSIRIAVTRLAADTTSILTETYGGAQVRDTISDNANLKKDTTYRAWMKYKGDDAKSNLWSAWSAPDTFVNSLVTNTIAFHSDWSTATGSTSSAILDSNKTNNWSSASPQCTSTPTAAVRVTATDSRDYPTTNYLRVKDDFCLLLVEDETFWSELAVGDTIFVRYYERVTLNYPSCPTPCQSHDIYFQEDNSGWGPPIAGQYMDGLQNASTINYKFSAAQNITRRYFSPAGTNGTPEFTLSKNTTYRFEWAVMRLTSTTYQMLFRLYSISGTLLYDTSQMNARPYYGLPSTPLSGETFTAPGGSGAFASTQGFSLGKEDAEGSGGDFAEYAAVAICLDGWCGAYDASREN